MRTNRFIFLSLISSVALFSCSPKANVFSENINKGTVTFITSNNKLAMQAYPKDNYQFDGWFLKDNTDGEYRFASISNPYMVEFTSNVTYQAKFEPTSTNKFDFTLEKDKFTQLYTHYSISNFYGVGSQFKDVIIPNVHYGYPVKEIKENTFANKTEIETIYIPQNISDIESGAFDNCTSIEKLYINNKLDYCGKAFTGWTSSQTIYVAESNFEGDSKVFDWEIEKDSSGEFYTAKIESQCGSTAVHIVKQ